MEPTAPRTPTATAPAALPDRTGGPGSSPVLRRDIQALRAVAVLLVVVDHFWPSGLLAGGYVGVDLFFVVSGYLITGHLVRELTGTGRVALGRFYARRALRLLPAAALVTVVSAALVALWLPQGAWTRTAVEGAGSALYVQNWLMALSTLSEAAAAAGPTPFQHYWSLSVEEQFYLLWPGLLLAVAAGAVRTGRGDPRRRLLVAVAAVSAVSFAVGVVHTELSSQTAYFATWTRVWEFGVGALVALGAGVPRGPRTARAAVAAGWAGVAACAVLYRGVEFPGVGALVPVLAAAAILAGGQAADRTGPELLTDRRVVQGIGNASYSVYLWHWPLVLVLPHALGREPGHAERALLVLGVLLLAAATRRWVELPGTRWRAPRTRPARAAAVAAALTAAPVAACLALGAAAGWSPLAP